jgi:hypothetical protein
MAKVYKSSKKLSTPRRPFKSWSINRPVKTEVLKDSGIMDELSGLATKAHGKASYWEVADQSGLCTSTISRLDKGMAQDGKLSTAIALAKSQGYKLKLVRD